MAQASPVIEAPDAPVAAAPAWFDQNPGVGPLSFEWAPIGTLKPYRSNPRRYSAKMLAQLDKTIDFTTYFAPILIDEEGGIIAGHARWLLAKQRSMPKVPVIRLVGLSETQKRTLRIADNKIRGEWDPELLKLELQSLQIELTSLELTGFNTAEFDMIVGDSFDDGERPISAAAPRSKLGDIWQCGDHLVGCGDARDVAFMGRLISGERAAACITDPPFNVSIKGFANRSSKHAEFAMASGEMSEEEFEIFMRESLSLAASISTETAVHFVFMDWRHMEILCRVGREVYNSQLNLCVWNKHNGGMGALYRSKHELIFVFKVGDGPHLNNVELGKYGRNRSNVLDYPSVNTFNAGRREDLKLHPTVKPVAMISDFMKDVTHRGDIVLDPFLGSGTSLIAAERVGRRLRGCDIDPGYVDMAVQRWQAITGETAALVICTPAGEGEVTTPVAEEVDDDVG